jgi:hypothetical protein
MPAHEGPSFGRRAVSILLVTGLHAALVFALLHFLVQQQSHPVVTAIRLLEMVLRPQRAEIPLQPTRRPKLPMAGQQPKTTGPPPAPALAPPAPTPDITGLGRALNDCAPENWTNLSPDDRARCPGVLHRPDESVMIEPRSHVKDPARREVEIAAKNTPGRIPCTRVETVMTPSGGVAVPMLDPGCAAKVASEGRH